MIYTQGPESSGREAQREVMRKMVGMLLFNVLSTGNDFFFSCVIQNGFAVVRPPGHHAEESTPM